MKKLLSLVIAVVMLMGIGVMPAFAQEGVAMGQVQTKDIITITVNGQYVDCSVYGQMPVIVEGRTLVPLRSVFEALGAEVAWNNDTRSAVSVKGDITVTLAIDSKELVVNGTVKTLDVPAQIMNERTMVPVRAVAEAFGCTVDWNNDTRTVVIVTAPEEVKANTPEAAVEGFTNALLALDLEEAAKYCENTDEIMNTLGGMTDLNAMIEMVVAASGEDLTEAQTAMVADFISEIVKLIKIEIGESTINGDMATVKVTMSMPDLDSVDANDYFDETEMTELYMNVLAENGYTMESLLTITDEAEIDKISDLVVEATLEYMIEVLHEAANDAPVIEETTDVALKLVNGNWIITE